MLPGFRAPFRNGAAAVLPLLTSPRTRSASARVIASTRCLPRRGFMWCSIRPRSALRVDAFLCPTPSA